MRPRSDTNKKPHPLTRGNRNDNKRSSSVINSKEVTESKTSEAVVLETITNICTPINSQNVISSDIITRLEKLEQLFNTFSIADRLCKLEKKADQITIIEPQVSITENTAVITFNLESCFRTIYLVTDLSNIPETKVILNHGLLSGVIKSEFKMLKLVIDDVSNLCPVHLSLEINL
jgi:hypothetical protein